MPCVLNVFTRNNRSHKKTKPKVSGIWCHLIHNLKLERQFPSFFSRQCVHSYCLAYIWTIKHPTRGLSTDPSPFRHPCAAGSTYACNTFTGGRAAAGNGPEKVEGCVFSVCSGDTAGAPNQTRQWRPPDPT